MMFFSPTLFLNSKSSSLVRQSDLAETWEPWFTAFEILHFTNCKIMMSLALTYHRNDVDFVTESLHELYVELFELVTIGCDEVEACVDPDLRSNFWWYDYEISFWHPIWWQHILSIIAKRITLYQEVLFCSRVFLPQGICQTAPQRSKKWDTLKWQLLGYYQGMVYLVTIIITW